ncbi:MAG: hypothetical protein RR832_02015 [Bacilli bacterium]
MEKEHLLLLLKELKNQLSFDDLSKFNEEERTQEIDSLFLELESLDKKLEKLRRKLEDDSNYIDLDTQNTNKQNRKEIEVLISNVNLEEKANKNYLEKYQKELESFNFEIAEKNDEIENLKSENLKLGETLRSLDEKEIIKLKEINEKLKINRERVTKLNLELEQDNFNLKNVNQKLEQSKNKIDTIKNDIDSANKLLEKFDENNSNEVIVDKDKKEKDKTTLKYGENLRKAIIQRKAILKYNFSEELDKMIKGLENDEIEPIKIEQEMVIFSKRIFEDFLNSDFENRQNELEENLREQETSERGIKYLKEKLLNKDNYLYSAFVLEKEKIESSRWDIKFKNCELDLEKNKAQILENEKDILDRENKLMSLEKEISNYENQLDELNSNSNPNLIVSVEDCINENKTKIRFINEDLINLNIEANNNLKQSQHLKSMKERYEAVTEKRRNNIKNKNGIDKFRMSVDEEELRKEVQTLNMLKTREQFLKTSVLEVLDKFNNHSDNKNIEEKIEKDSKPEQLEIISIKRPLKERIKENMKKIAATVISSLIIAAIVLTPSIDKEKEEENVTKIVYEQLDKENLEEENLEEEILEINVNDKIIVNNDAPIYSNQIDASTKENPLTPYNDKEQEKNVIGITLTMPDGTYKFAQTESQINFLKEKGGIISAYLTGNNDTPEGYWNSKDVVKINQNEKEDGGLSR